MRSSLRKLCTVAGWAVELGILIGLFWKYLDVGHNVFFYGGNAAIYPGCLIFGCGVVMNWLLVADRTQFRLWLLTGPCVVMAGFLLVMLSWQSGAFVSKDISTAAWEKQVPKVFYDQWLKDHFDRVESERLTCAIIVASTCLLYASRFSTVRRQSIQQPLMPGIAEQGKGMSSPIEER